MVSVSFIRDEALEGLLEGFQQSSNEADDLERRAAQLIIAANANRRRARAYELGLESFLRPRCEVGVETVIVAHGRAIVATRPADGFAIRAVVDLSESEDGVVDLDELLASA